MRPKLNTMGLEVVPFVLVLDRTHMLECEEEQKQQQHRDGGGDSGSGGGGGGGGREGGITGETTTTRHSLKPLQLIWARFPHYGWTENNTLMVDDKDRSFALSPGNGVKVKEFWRGEVWKEGGQGGREGGREELVWLATYLEEVGREWHAQGRAVSSMVPGREGRGGGAWPHAAWRERGMGVV